MQCEACYTPLPELTTCPSCGASVQSDASFCGQCGFSLLPAVSAVEQSPPLPVATIPPLIPPEPLLTPDPIAVGATPASDLEPSPVSTGAGFSPLSPAVETAAASISQPTLLQQPAACLLHLQTNTPVELPPHLSVIHIGKPNDRIPPDIDVSGFPSSEIVSRIHADMRVEAGAYYIEDVGSSNGTYVNNAPLPAGNRHRLRAGDRISLGKGDKVTFLFQMS